MNEFEVALYSLLNNEQRTRQCRCSRAGEGIAIPTHTKLSQMHFAKGVDAHYPCRSSRLPIRRAVFRIHRIRGATCFDETNCQPLGIRNHRLLVYKEHYRVTNMNYAVSTALFRSETYTMLILL